MRKKIAIYYSTLQLGTKMKKLLFIAILFTASVGFTAEICPTDFAKKKQSCVAVKVKGAVCEFCMRGIDKGLTKLGVTDNFTADLKKSELYFLVKKGKKLDDSAIKKIVEDNGLGVKEIKR
jgi:copper chaperone CopZ